MYDFTLSLWNVATLTPIFMFIAIMIFRFFGQPNPTWPIDHKTIPRRIFIAAFEPTETEKVGARWQRLNPQATVRIYTKQDCRRMVAYVGDWTVNLFDRLPSNHQMDFWRVCVLFLYGGIAVDSSVEPVMRFDDAVFPSATFATAFVPLFIASTQANPIIEHIIDYYFRHFNQPVSTDQSLLAIAIDSILKPVCVIDESDQFIHNFGQKVIILQTKHSFPRPWIWESEETWNIWRISTSLCDNNGKVFLFRDAVSPI